MKRTYRIWSRRHDLHAADSTYEFEGETVEVCDENACAFFEKEYVEKRGCDCDDLIVYRIDAPAVPEQKTQLALKGTDKILVQEANSQSDAA